MFGPEVQLVVVGACLVFPYFSLRSVSTYLRIMLYKQFTASCILVVCFENLGLFRVPFPFNIISDVFGFEFVLASAFHLSYLYYVFPLTLPALHIFCSPQGL